MAKAKGTVRAGVAKGGDGGARNRRGSPEAIEKRKVARMFNDLLGGRGTTSQKLDGRTEKRRQRLLRELEQGQAHGEKELKPLDVLTRVQELLDLGEPVSSIRKVCKAPKALPGNEGMIELVKRLHQAYGFRPEAYRFVGIPDEVLGQAGVVHTDGSRRGGKRKRAAA